MSRLRDFFIGVPKACGVENHEAWGKMNELAFDHEVDNQGSVFARRAEVRLEVRMLPAFGFRYDPDHDVDAADYAFQLATLAALSYGVAKGLGGETERNNLAMELEAVELNFPSISALLTVKEASTVGQWA